MRAWYLMGGGGATYDVPPWGEADGDTMEDGGRAPNT